MGREDGRRYNMLVLRGEREREKEKTGGVLLGMAVFSVLGGSQTIQRPSGEMRVSMLQDDLFCLLSNTFPPPSDFFPSLLNLRWQMG